MRQATDMNELGNKPHKSQSDPRTARRRTPQKGLNLNLNLKPILIQPRCRAKEVSFRDIKYHLPYPPRCAHKRTKASGYDQTGQKLYEVCRVRFQ